MSPTVRVVPSTAPRAARHAKSRCRPCTCSPSLSVFCVVRKICVQRRRRLHRARVFQASVTGFHGERTRLLAAVRRTPRCRRAWEAGMSLPDGSAQQEVEGGDRPMRFNVAVRRLTPRIPMTAPFMRAASCACGQFWHDNSPRSASTGQRQSTCSSRGSRAAEIARIEPAGSRRGIQG